MKDLKTAFKKATINRVTALGYILLVVGPISFVCTKNYGHLIFGSFIVLLLGVLFVIDPDMGENTYQAYKRTKKHIQRFNRLDKRFAAKFLKNYCARQGVYMAAKESDCLSDFQKAIRGKIIILRNI